MPLSRAETARFRKLLDDRARQIIEDARSAPADDVALDADDLPDEMDLASSELPQSRSSRMRGRERSLLERIERAVARLDDGSFGTCEACGEEISVERLEARPETTRCVQCEGEP
ncbi:MAG: TraR/DksA C4-type zinc finger protein [Polyangiales bacterium]